MSLLEYLRHIFYNTKKVDNDIQQANASLFKKIHTRLTKVIAYTTHKSDLNNSLETLTSSDTANLSSLEQSTISFDTLVRNFINQFQFDPKTESPFIYQEGNLQTFQCVLLVSRLALQHYQIKNFFCDDNTIVYFTTFRKDNPTVIGLMHFLLKKSMCLQSFSIYGFDGSAILSELVMAQTREKTTYSDGAKLFIEKTLQYTLEYPIISSITLLEQFLRMNLHDSTANDYARVNADLNVNIYEGICEILGIDSGASVRWKKEYSLYLLVKKYYKDAIYQYRAEWLGQQSLDIFIPSLNIGIEYQGIQHYRSIQLFGGEDGFRIRKINDEKKRIKCKQNQVILLEWPYKDEITAGNLQIKLKELRISICLPERTETSLLSNNEQVEKDYQEEAAIRFINQESNHDNLAKKLYDIQIKAEENSQDGIRDTLCNVIANFPEQKILPFFKIVLQYDNPSIYKAICSNEKLLNYWASTGILNYYGRQLVFTLIKESPTSERAAEYLKKMRALERKRGRNPNVRFMNSIIREEAEDNGVSKERIGAILRKSY